MKTNIKMKCDDNQFRKVMDILKLDYNHRLHYEDMYIIINSHLSTEWGYGGTIYNDSRCEEIDADLFIRTNGTCEETFKERADSYFKQADDYYKKVEDSISNLIIVELQNKLKKKNEILKKARIKRKNQREELNKLNLKLQKCISLVEHRKVLDWHIERNESLFAEIDNLKAENIEMGKLVNLNKSALDLAVMTKELAMNKIERKNNEIEKLKVVIEYLESKVK